MSINAVDETGVSIFHYACGRGHLDIVRACIEHGADLSEENGAVTPLTLAVKNAHVAVVTLLPLQLVRRLPSQTTWPTPFVRYAPTANAIFAAEVVAPLAAAATRDGGDAGADDASAPPPAPPSTATALTYLHCAIVDMATPRGGCERATPRWC